MKKLLITMLALVFSMGTFAGGGADVDAKAAADQATEKMDHGDKDHDDADKDDGEKDDSDKDEDSDDEKEDGE